MDDDTLAISDLSFEEKISALEDGLPSAIRDFLHSRERDQVSFRLTKKYNLHVDQAAAFEKAYLFMLLGVNTPEDFVQDLQAAGIDQESIRGLTSDINDQVFKPLQHKTLSASDVPKAPEKATSVPVMQITPTPPVPPPAPKPVEAPTEIPSQPVRPVAAPVTPAPIPEQVTSPLTETPPYNLIRPEVLVSVTKPIMLHSMKLDMEAMKHPTVPQTVGPLSTRPTLTMDQLTPARSFQTASVPYSSATPPAPRPLMHVTATPIVPAQLTQPAQPPQLAAPYTVPSPTAASTSSAPLSGDPYRESIS